MGRSEGGYLPQRVLMNFADENCGDVILRNWIMESTQNTENRNGNDFGSMLSEIELESVCLSCHGKGRWLEEGSGRKRVCARCDGSGFTRTEFGEKILSLLRHNLQPLIESASSPDGL